MSTAPAPGLARWFTPARLIEIVRDNPGITRAAAAAEVGIGTGAATDLMARMRAAELLDETRAPAAGRGRPTTILQPHPAGPLVVAVELRITGWRVAISDISGAPQVLAEFDSMPADYRVAFADIGAVVADVCAQEGRRVRAVSVSAAGAIHDGELAQFPMFDWSDIDMSLLTAQLPDRDMPILLGNDATLAGLAESRTGAARGVGTVLHLMVAVGLGGALIIDGVPVTGAHGGAGEYGHVPFGDPSQRCPCGAQGCWNLTIDGNALAAHLGDPPPTNPVRYARERLAARAEGTVVDPTAVDDPRVDAAFAEIASALGRGIAGLVNIHDPDAVTLGGLAGPFRAAALVAFDAAYRNGLMEFRKLLPPNVIDGVHGDDGPLRGAALRGVDHVTTPDALAQWDRR